MLSTQQDEQQGISTTKGSTARGTVTPSLCGSSNPPTATSGVTIDANQFQQLLTAVRPRQPARVGPPQEPTFALMLGQANAN